MKRINVAFAAFVLVAACGGSDSGTTTTGGGTSGTTAGTTATTAAATTTTEAASPLDARLAIVEAFAGEYEGTWTNATFGSTGTITITNSNVTDFGTLTLTLDVGGSAFGAGDPDEDFVEIDLHPDPPQVLGSFLGFGLDSPTLTFNDDGSWSLVATPDDLGGGQLLVELTLTADGFEGTYIVTGPDGVAFAEGTFSATRTG